MRENGAASAPPSGQAGCQFATVGLVHRPRPTINIVRGERQEIKYVHFALGGMCRNEIPFPARPPILGRLAVDIQRTIPFGTVLASSTECNRKEQISRRAPLTQRRITLPCLRRRPFSFSSLSSGRCQPPLPPWSTSRMTTPVKRPRPPCNRRRTARLARVSFRSLLAWEPGNSDPWPECGSLAHF